MKKQQDEDLDPAADIFAKTPKDLDKEVKKGLKDFDALLGKLSSLHEKKKFLWREIYENAVMDRRNAYIMFTDLYQKVHNNITEHAIHGANLSKYMERLNKSNEQLIRLAEILDDAVTTDEDSTLDQENLYKSLESHNSAIQADHRSQEDDEANDNEEKE